MIKNEEYLKSLLVELVRLPKETEWLEFKLNNAIGDEIGEYISALSNSAAICGKPTAYMIWGVDDNTHEPVGTKFKPSYQKVGNEAIENWIVRLLNPGVNFKFYEFDFNEVNIVILEIPAAFSQPVQFKNIEYIRIGSYKKKLKDHIEKERELWEIFTRIPFEKRCAVENISDDEVINLLDYPGYFKLLKLPLPKNKNGIIESLESENMIYRNETGKWNIANLGAILFATKLSDFNGLNRKGVRVISYKGDSKIETIKEQSGLKGYAVGFGGLIDYINGLLPSNEVIKRALRENVSMYPELAIRELVANAIIHQNFSITGQGVMVEIFENRIEITNPGETLIDVNRLLDTPPRSRNEMLASLMRRIGICEERGSGIDKVVFETEYYQLPAPLFENVNNNTRAILFAHKPLKRMDKKDRIRACYLHACLRYVNRDYMTNTSIRDRFGIDVRNSAAASRYIREALEDGFIIMQDKDAPPKYRKYIPYWASDSNDI